MQGIGEHSSFPSKIRLNLNSDDVLKFRNLKMVVTLKIDLEQQINISMF